MPKAIFLDRDGIINVNNGYVGSIERLQFCDGIFELAKYLNERNISLFIVTNQSGIGRGFFSEALFLKLMDYINRKFSAHGSLIKDFRYCPHTPIDGCKCRKPHPKMVLELSNLYGINPKKSAFLGDSFSDVECGNKAGVKYNFLIDNATTMPRMETFFSSHKSIFDLMKSNEWHEFIAS